MKHNRRSASILKHIITLVVAVLMLSSLTLTAYAAEITANETGDRNVLFSNGYRGFCLDNQLHCAYSGDVFTPSDTSSATSNANNNDVSQYLKKLFTVCFDDVFKYNEAASAYEIKDTNTIQAVVWHFTDNIYVWGEQLKLVNAIKAYDGPNIPDSGYKLQLDNGHTITFHFVVMKAQSGETQDFFAYRLEIAKEVPHEHEYTDAWESDDTQHWHECKCGEKSAAAGHIETVINWKEPTAFEDGYTGDTVCEICGRLLREGQSIPGTHEHSFGETWKTSDTQHWHECKCGEKKDVAYHIEIVINQVAPSEFEEGYTGDTVCDICGTLLEEGEVLPATHVHTFSESWQSSDTQHWHECKCGEKDAVSGHTETVINRKEATEFEDGYTGDTVCEICGRLLKEGQIIPGTHEHSFGETWKTSDTQHWHECKCGEKDAVADHTETVINRKEATEFEDGYTGDTVCEICERLLKEGQSIPGTHEHSFGETWESSDTQHWHECMCGEKKDVTYHIEIVINQVAPSEFEEGYTGDTVCDVCGTLLEEGEVLPATHVHTFGETWESSDTQHWHECKCGEKDAVSGHTETVINREEATEFEAGYTGDTVCEVCGRLLREGQSIPGAHEHSFGEAWKTSDTQHWHECTCGEKKDVTYHIEIVINQVAPSEFEEGYTGDTVCDVCGTLLEEGEVLPATHVHTFSETWQSNDTQHWHECKCGEKSDLVVHVEIIVNQVNPSEFEEGYSGDTVCEVCDRLLKEGEILPATHVHTFSENWKSSDTQHWHECTCGEKSAVSGHTETVINRKEATEFEDGYTGDTVCETCGRLLKEGEVIPIAHEHSFGNTWEYDDTQHWRECTCGAIIDRASHKGGKATCKDLPRCSECNTPYGSKDPNKHVGGTKLCGFVEPTEYKTGYTGDIYCRSCNELIKKGARTPMLSNAAPPPTGDQFNLHFWLILSLVSLTGCVFTLLIFKKKYRK